MGYTRWLSRIKKNRGKWLGLDKAIIEIIKPHYFVLGSSLEFVSLKKKFLIAGLPEFYCGLNEPSHATQFKWLEYTFSIATNASFTRKSDHFRQYTHPLTAQILCGGSLKLRYS
jgi:hypothetical protein